ncbi:response regulator [Breoghania sp.]|uniref:response regulator n=1 Tax=Breoghania sp. TaxID=2065378 RepID=UPI002621CA59|nr:response regulator [Breoghania sp.]
MAAALIVDDDKDWLKLVEIILAAQGLRMEACDSPATALDVAQRLQPNLIVLDVMMERMDGFQLLWHLTNDNITAGIPIVLLSSRDRPADIDWGRRLGAADYISKHMAVRELTETLARKAHSLMQASLAGTRGLVPGRV